MDQCSVLTRIELAGGFGRWTLRGGFIVAPAIVSRVKNTVIALLAVSSGALGILALRQQAEINRLSVARNDARGLAPLRTIYTASKRTFPMPARSSAAWRQAGAGDDRTAQTLLLGELSSSRAPLRRTGSVARLMENPEFVEALSRQHHAMLDTRFAALFRRLNLAPEELAAFKSLLVEKENVALDVVTVSEALPDGPLSPDALRASIRAAQEQVEQAIHGSLGAERYEMYREFERTLPQRATVAQLERRLSYSDAPLSSSQAESLTQIMVNLAPTRPVLEPAAVVSVLLRSGVPEAVPMLPTTVATGRVTDPVVAQAQTLLSPVQLQALRELQQEQEAAERAAELIRQIAPSTVGTGYSTFLLQ